VDKETGKKGSKTDVIPFFCRRYPGAGCNENSIRYFFKTRYDGIVRDIPNKTNGKYPPAEPGLFFVLSPPNNPQNRAIEAPGAVPSPQKVEITLS
jgi:hypothetical protein